MPVFTSSNASSRPCSSQSWRSALKKDCGAERTLKSDDAIALGMALGELIAAHALDHAFHRFRAGIAEEHEVGKALLAEPRGELLAVRALEQVRHVPEFRRLLLK